MTPAAFLYLFGMLAILLGERVVGGEDPVRYGFSGVGLLLVLGALGFVAKGRSGTTGENGDAYTKQLVWGGVGVLSLVVYGLATDPVVGAIGFADDQSEHRYTVVITALWPIIWLAGTLPFLALDRAIARSPILVTAGRVREASFGALATAFALAWVFPLNYLGTEFNERWDLGYFKTAEVGTRTQSLVASLDRPIEAYLFFPGSSDVTPEIRGYFDELNNPNLTISYVDHALEPELSKELKVRDNGNIALVRRVVNEEGEEEEPQIERIKIGTEFDSAKRKLKKLDEEVQQSLTKLVAGKRVAYFTTGHGEMYWKSGDDRGKKQQIRNVKKVLESLNYSVKELGLAEGLAQEVPEDADIVFIMGPIEELLEAEVDALNAYRQSGGAMWVALEPDGAALTGLLEPMGLSVNTDQILASEKQYLLETRGVADRINLITNKFSSHDSVTNVSRAGQQAVLAMPGAVPITETGGGEGKVNVTVRSLPDVWLDDGDYEKTSDDKTETHKLAAAVTQGSGETELRAIVMGDGTWASDVLLGQRMFANLQFLVDGLSWLNEDETMTGTTESEEDVKIQHTREGQGWWFYATAVFVPIGFMGLVAARVRGRRKRGEK